MFGDPDRSINPLDFMIDLTRSGNQMLRGNVRRWAEMQERLKRVYFAPLRARYGMSDLTFRNMDLIRLVVPAASIPEQTVSASPSETVPFTRWAPVIDRKRLVQAAGDVVIDGDRVLAVFDTNSFTGTLPQDYATSHRLRVVAHSDVMADGSGRTFSQNIVLVPSIAIVARSSRTRSSRWRRSRSRSWACSSSPVSGM